MEEKTGSQLAISLFSVTVKFELLANLNFANRSVFQ